MAIVSVSGGKDSTATALLAIDRLGRENCRIVFADTGNEHELTYEYVYDYLGAALELPIETVQADFTRHMAGKRVYVENKWPGKGVPDDIVQRAMEVLHPTGVPFIDLCL
jgi:3'-phosphoadenosine 5'-phosphosulfate sulfotransferase (PAPS reductase)/FAD synthetase